MEATAARAPQADERDLELLDQLSAAVRALEAEIGKQVVGQRSVVEGLLTALLADGHVLFDVSSMPDYGKLSRRSLDEMIAGRVGAGTASGTEIPHKIVAVEAGNCLVAIADFGGARLISPAIPQAVPGQSCQVVIRTSEIRLSHEPFAAGTTPRRRRLLLALGRKD